MASANGAQATLGEKLNGSIFCATVSAKRLPGSKKRETLTPSTEELRLARKSVVDFHAKEHAHRKDRSR